MVNYEYGKIYKLYSKQQNITYIGSTAMYYLSQRMATHRGTYKMYLNGKYPYITSFKILECEDYKIELIEDYPCTNKHQLKTRERWYIENNELVNKNIPTRTMDEYYQDNKDKLLVYNKEWREANKDKIKELTKKYNEANKDKIKEKGKKYREANKETINQRQKEYSEANKDKINTRASQVIVCECGCQIRTDCLARHKKSKKHLDLVQNKF